MHCVCCKCASSRLCATLPPSRHLDLPAPRQPTPHRLKLALINGAHLARLLQRRKVLSQPLLLQLAAGAQERT